MSPVCGIFFSNFSSTLKKKNTFDPVKPASTIVFGPSNYYLVDYNPMPSLLIPVQYPAHLTVADSDAVGEGGQAQVRVDQGGGHSDLWGEGG